MTVGDEARVRTPEWVVSAVSAAIIALNVILTSLVLLPPGARLSDHAVETALPLAVLAAVGALYPRLRPGLRGTVGLLFGSLMLIWAGLAAADAFQTGFRPGLTTGLLLLPTGLALVGSAGSLLMRTRQSGGRRCLRRALWVVLGLLIGYWFVLPVGFAAYATHRPQTPVPPFVTSVEAIDVSVKTSDGLRLQGWYIPSRNGAAVLAYPREWTTSHALMLADQGYGVLLLDMRGYGDSEGDPNAFGWGCTPDIEAGLTFLEERRDVDAGRIGGLGLSVGGEQMMEAAAGDPRLKAIVSDGAGERSVRESLIRGPKGLVALPMMAVQTASTWVFSQDPVPRALDDIAAEISPRALLLIHAEFGGGGEELNPEYFAAAGEPKSLWTIPGVTHTAGVHSLPDEYAARVGGFFDEHLLR